MNKKDKVTFIPIETFKSESLMKREEQERLNKLPITRGDLMKLFDGESEDEKLHDAFEKFLKEWVESNLEVRLDIGDLPIDARVRVW
tara:strand:+ start:228 stop:488 length:261 start_codon:yes stop_codon:yes gene_type:complete